MFDKPLVKAILIKLWPQDRSSILDIYIFL